MATGLALGPIVLLARWACSVSWYRYTYVTEKGPSGRFALALATEKPFMLPIPSYTDPGQGLFSRTRG